MTLYSDALRVAFFANHHPDAEPSSVEMAKLEKSIRAYLSAAALASREPSPVASEGVKESLRAIAVEFETDGREGRAANVDAIAAHITALEAEVARKDDALDNAGKLILDKIAEVAKLTKERDEARVNKADLVYMAKLIKKLRSKFINIADHVEDEGDRAYFGSSNDADDFIQAVRDLDDANWSLILDKAKGRDLYAEMRKLRSALAKSEASREAAEARVAEAVKVISDLICTNPYQPQKAAEAARTWMEGGR